MRLNRSKLALAFLVTAGGLLAAPPILAQGPSTHPVFATLDWVRDQVEALRQSTQQSLGALDQRLELQERRLDTQGEAIGDLRTSSELLSARLGEHSSLLGTLENRAQALEEKLAGLPSPPSPDDDFEDDFLDGARWATYANPGHTVEESGGRLLLNRVAGAPGWGGVDSRFRISGDFDVHVDFQFIEWPASVQKLGIVAQGESRFNTVERISGWGSDGEVYLTHFDDGILFLPTTDTQGRLRVTRSGNLWRGYFWRDGAWQLVHQGPGIQQEVQIQLKLFGPQSLAARVSFDNFRVSAGRVIWP